MEDTPTEIRKSVRTSMVEVWTDDSRRAAELIRKDTGIEGVSVYGDRLHIALENKELLDSIFQSLRKEGIMVKDHREILPSIEDVFISMVQRQ
jgi:ABC-2 type transport system ATP-binding protein